MELAEHYIKLFHGVEIFYEQYQVLESSTRDELKADHQLPKVIWYQTLIDASIGKNTRNLRWRGKFPMDNPPIRHRVSKRSESMMWQFAMPCYDFELWYPESHWMVNPNSGCKLAEMRANDAAFPCYIKHPDVSFWEAVGHLEGASNGRRIRPVSNTRTGGLWESPAEYQDAWGSDCYCDPEDAVNQNPRQYSDQSRAWGRSTGGRAASPRQQSRRY